MSISLAENLKRLRKDKNVSQEKLANYLGVSFQTISKWETASACPDITLLPDISRFYGITVDELLQVEQLDEERLFKQYNEKAEDLFRTGKYDKALEIWQEAYKCMPNNFDVKEMLMSHYFDLDRGQKEKKYFNEFLELAMEIYNSDNASGYYKGQAISQIARSYAEVGNDKLSHQWAEKSISLFNSKEIISAQISRNEDLVDSISFCTYWFLEEMFYFVVRLASEDNTLSDEYKKKSLETVTRVYSAVCQNSDFGFEQLQHLCILHMEIARYECLYKNSETAVRINIEKAFDYAVKSTSITEHKSAEPMLYGWQVTATPSDNNINLRIIQNKLSDSDYDNYRNAEWLMSINTKLTKQLEK